jgi:gas vesicle protein
MNSSAKTILGILAAGAAGVAIGMLLAPEKGSAIRKSIKEKLAETSEGLASMLDNIVSSAKEILESSKDHLSDAKQEAISKGAELKSELKHEGHKVKNALS